MLFLPLNNLKWVNEYIFHNNPRSTPPITFQGLLWIIIGITSARLIWIMLCVSERDPHFNEQEGRYEEESGSKFGRVWTVLKTLPSFFTNRTTLRLIIHFIIKYIGIYAIAPLLQLEMIKYGLKSADCAIIDLFTLPGSICIAIIGIFVYINFFLKRRKFCKKRSKSTFMSVYLFIFFDWNNLVVLYSNGL